MTLATGTATADIALLVPVKTQVNWLATTAPRCL